ncbi:MAG: hypothetical protein AAGK14_12985 [Verrucomicrobiota bacterium]
MKRLALITSSSVLADAVTKSLKARGDFAVDLRASASGLKESGSAQDTAGILFDAAPDSDPEKEIRELTREPAWARKPVLLFCLPTQPRGKLAAALPNVVAEISKPLDLEELQEKVTDLVRTPAGEPGPTQTHAMSDAPQDVAKSLPGVTDAFVWSVSGQLEHATSPKAAQFNATMGFALQVANRMSDEAELGDFNGLQIQGNEGCAIFFSAVTSRQDSSQYRTFGLLTDGSTDPDAAMTSLQEKLLS